MGGGARSPLKIKKRGRRKLPQAVEVRRPPGRRRGRRVILIIDVYSVVELIAEKGGRGRGFTPNRLFCKKRAFFRETSSRGGAIRAFDCGVSDGAKGGIWAVFPREIAPFETRAFP